MRFKIRSAPVPAAPVGVAPTESPARETHPTVRPANARRIRRDAESDTRDARAPQNQFLSVSIRVYPWLKFLVAAPPCFALALNRSCQFVEFVSRRCPSAVLSRKVLFSRPNFYRKRSQGTQRRSFISLRSLCSLAAVCISGYGVRRGRTSADDIALATLDVSARSP
jgi:hypothetical protein